MGDEERKPSLATRDPEVQPCCSPPLYRRRRSSGFGSVPSMTQRASGAFRVCELAAEMPVLTDQSCNELDTEQKSHRRHELRGLLQASGIVQGTRFSDPWQPTVSERNLPPGRS